MIVELTYVSSPRLRRGCPFAGVVKTARYRGKVGEPEGQNARAWGESKHGLIWHKGKVYLEVSSIEVLSVEYTDTEGTQISDVEQWVSENTTAVKTFEIGAIQCLSYSST